ncbi:MAG: hypothetical protein ABW205_09795, partial [Burkholderiales bacterium]
RMWEDPFDAVARYRIRQQAEQQGAEERKQRQSLVEAVQCLNAPSKEACRKGPEDFKVEASQRHAERRNQEKSIRGWLSTGNGTLLVVTVTGAPYGMAGEFRRKQRYAILSGLHLAGFEPFDPDHIGFIDFEDLSGEKLPLPSVLPWEVFYRRTAKGDTENLVIAWFNEDVLWSDDPLEQLHELFERIAYGENTKIKRDGLAIKVLGPGSSGILKQMVRELREDYLVRPRSAARGEELAARFQTSRAEFYASSPTASDASLVESMTEASSCLPGEIDAVEELQKKHRLVEAEFRCRGVSLSRITVTDEKLADALADELQLRGAWQTVTGILGMDLGKASEDDIVEGVRKSPRVVLVSEWDTHYGREFPAIMRDALLADVTKRETREALCPSQRLTDGSARAPDCPIHYFTYMMGLDGQLPRAGEVREAAPVADKSDKQRERGREVERPVGSSQLDYLRRLGEKVLALEEELRSEGNRIGAVGVLGTDPYDKLLVMQALHPALPEAIFFTTDLDALYLHPTEVKRGTKNLVVASAFGLELSDRWQGSIMPFRDSYQTGAFLSTRVALGEKQDSDMLARSLQAPRIYEIGRNSIVDLSPAASVKDCEGALCETIHPARPVPQYRVRAVSAVVFAFVVLMVLFAFGFRQIQYGLAVLGGIVRARPVVSVIGLVSLTVFLGLCFRALQDATGEPWAIANGVSMWPTQILRMIALAATWLLLYKGWHDLVRSNEKLGREFLLDSGPAPEQPALQESTLTRAAHRTHSLGEIIRYRFRPWEKESAYDKHERIGVAEIWRDYVVPAGFGERLWLLVIPIALYLAFTAVLFVVLGVPTRPYRGTFILVLDNMMVALCVASFLTLLFFVIEETRRTCAFVRRLARPSRWPTEVLERFGQRPGLADSNSLHPDLTAYQEDWVEIDLIGQRTEVVTRLIYYPFIITTLLALARSSTFDNWSTPPALIVTFGLSILIALSTAVTLRMAAERARGAALDSLTNKLQRAEQLGEERIAAEIRILIDRVRDTNQGAFCPFSQQPWLKAVLIPLGSLSAVPILEFLAAASL